MEVLNDRNFLLYCAKNYSNPQCHSTEEFLEDVNRIKYIKKLLTRWQERGELKDRLILNHLIVLHNVFSPEVLCRILYLKMVQHMSLLKPFLVYLGIMVELIRNVSEEGIIRTDEIGMDQGIIDALRRI
jgi:hypothetical protein